jgi:hypothetical protein
MSRPSSKADRTTWRYILEIIAQILIALCALAYASGGYNQIQQESTVQQAMDTPGNTSIVPPSTIENEDSEILPGGNQAPCENRDSDLCQQWRMAQAAERQNTITIIEAAALGVSLVLSLVALGISIWTARMAIRTSRAELRAYVSGTPNFIVAFDASHPAGARFDIKNVGHTPAHKVQSRSTVDVFSEPLPSNFVFPEIAQPATPPATLFRDELLIGSITARRLFSAAEIADVQIRKACIYVYGIITYEDGFGVARTTRFSRSVLADNANITKLTQLWVPPDLTINFATTEQHNEAT